MKPETIQQVRREMAALRLCGCGGGVEWHVLLDLLSSPEMQDGHADDVWREFGLKVIDSWELTEHGTTVRYGWLSDKGTAWLAFLKEFGTDEGEWPKRVLWKVTCSVEKNSYATTDPDGKCASCGAPASAVEDGFDED